MSHITPTSPIPITPSREQLASAHTQRTLSNTNLGSRLSTPATTLNAHLGNSLVIDAPIHQHTPAARLQQSLDAVVATEATVPESLGKATEAIHKQNEKVKSEKTMTEADQAQAQLQAQMQVQAQVKQKSLAA